MTDRREELEALRSRLRAEIECCDTRDLAALSRELRQVLGELEGIPDPRSVSVVGDIAQQRELRRLKAAGQ